MEHILQNLETENIQLTERVTDLEAENHRLIQQNTVLEKALEKQKKFHRKYAEDVVETERIRVEDFKSEKRSLMEANTSLVKENRQLTKDGSFYKKAYDELVKEDKSVHTMHLNQRQAKVEPAHTKRSSQRSAMTSTSAHELTSEPELKSAPATASECKHRSSRALTKISEQLFAENKKLKLKMNNLTATVLHLKTKNKQLENFKNKTMNKKLKFAQQVDELGLLVNSTKIKNGYTFSPEILARLDQLGSN